MIYLGIAVMSVALAAGCFISDAQNRRKLRRIEENTRISGTATHAYVCPGVSNGKSTTTIIFHRGDFMMTTDGPKVYCPVCGTHDGQRVKHDLLPVAVTQLEEEVA